MPLPQPQYGILRFAKYKGPQIGSIEAHNERTKEKYASNPDVDTSRSKRNFHLIKPAYKYHAEVERQITAAGCRTRKDSVRMVEALITASPEVFEGMKRSEIRAYFEYAMDFIKQKQDPSTIISAVVHMDEKTPHLHLCFVPLTPDGRLSAKEIIGNRKKLIQWQDEFWQHMGKRYPALERGESASKTGRTYLPPQAYKDSVHLDSQRTKAQQIIHEMTPLNAKKKGQELEQLLQEIFPQSERFGTALKKQEQAIRQAAADNRRLKKEAQETKESKVQRQLEEATMQAENENLRRTLECIPPEIVAEYLHLNRQRSR
jgi:hypothetical protein